MEILRLRIAVSEEHIRAADLVELIGATNSLYELLAKALYMPELFRSTDNDLPPDAVLRITYMRSGSDSDFDLLGLDKAIRELPKIHRTDSGAQSKKNQGGN